MVYVYHLLYNEINIYSVRKREMVGHSYCTRTAIRPSHDLSACAPVSLYDAGWSSLVARRTHNPKAANRNSTCANVFRAPELRALI